MKCENCKKPIEKDYLVCPFCTSPITSHQNEHGIINAGENNINIGLGVNSTQEFYIENLNVSKETDETIVYYKDRLERRVVGGVDGYKLKFKLSVILSIVSAIITIVGYFQTKSSNVSLFMMVTLGLLIYAFESKNRYKKLKDNGIIYRNQKPILSLEEDGKLYKVSKFGICPICQGRVFIYYDERFNKSLGKCEKNRDHLYTYDHTIDAGFPYTTFDIYYSK